MVDELQIFHHVDQEQLRALGQLVGPNSLKELPEFVGEAELRFRVDEFLSVLLLLTFKLLGIFLLRRG